MTDQTVTQPKWVLSQYYRRLFSEKSFNLLNYMSLKIQDPNIQKSYDRRRNSKYNDQFWFGVALFVIYVAGKFIIYYDDTMEVSVATVVRRAFELPFIPIWYLVMTKWHDYSALSCFAILVWNGALSIMSGFGLLPDLLTVDNLQYDEDLMVGAMILFFAFNYNSWSLTFWLAPALIIVPYAIQIS